MSGTATIWAVAIASVICCTFARAAYSGHDARQATLIPTATSILAPPRNEIISAATSGLKAAVSHGVNPIIPGAVLNLISSSLTSTPSRVRVSTSTFTNDSNATAASPLNAAVGDISAAEIYTVQATMPSPNVVTATATGMSDGTNSASAKENFVTLVGKTYYLATGPDGGSDSNDGLSSGKPWLTPNHPVRCGDVVLAAASSSYSAANFSLNFGHVTCPTGNNVAWLKCAKFDSCKITAAGSGIWVDQSYWGVEGWEVSTTGGNFSPCFYASPGSSTKPTIHHIVFANDIANGCYGSGFALSNQGPVGVDYFAVVGSIIYNSVQGGAACFSGMNIAAPVQRDTLPGTHIYLAGIYDWDNFEPATCNGGTPTDGEGIILDTLDAESYSQQVVVENNISFLNGSSGIKVGITTAAPIYIRNNTLYDNNRDRHLGDGECGEIVSQGADNVTVTRNLIWSNTHGCGGGPSYGLFVQEPYAGDVFDNNLVYSPAGNNMGQSGGFAFGSRNVFGIDPGLASAPHINAGPPVCGSTGSVPACVASIIKAFTPTNAAAAGYGYRAPSSRPTYEPEFPRWLCNVGLPEGLITMGCRTAP